MRSLVDAGADGNVQRKDGWTALMLAMKHGNAHAEAMVRLLVAGGATLPPDAKLDEQLPDVPPALVAYIEGARNWTPLHRAADARDVDALRECLMLGANPDKAVDTSRRIRRRWRGYASQEQPHMRTALSIAKSESYPTARPVCERCLALLRLGGCGMVKGAAPAGGGGGGGGGGGASRQSRHK